MHGPGGIATRVVFPGGTLFDALASGVSARDLYGTCSCGRAIQDLWQACMPTDAGVSDVTG